MRTRWLVAAIVLCVLTRPTNADATDIDCVTFTRNQVDGARKFWTDINKSTATPAEMPPFSPSDALFPDDANYDEFVGRFAVWSDAFRTLSGSVFTPRTPNRSSAPFRAVGKFFYRPTLVSIKKDWCTAAITADPKILLTAAHCVHRVRPATFFSDLYFTRAYELNGGENFAIAAAGIYKGWFAGGVTHDELDYAFLLLQDASSDPTVVPLTISMTPRQNWIAVAYPDVIIRNGAPIRLNGNEMRDADGVVGGSVATGMTLMVRTPFGHGASGGPWIPPSTTGSSGEVLSVASKLGPYVNSLLGPNFTADTLRLLQFVKKNCH